MLFANPILKTFLAVVECGTVHAAAKRLHITQTAVTQRIKKLESAVGVEVFVRSKKGMRLNASGKVLLGYARRLEKLSQAGHNEITGLGVRGKVAVTISAATTLMEARILPAITPVLDANPQLYVSLDADDDGPALEKKLNNFSSDIIISEEINLSGSAVYKSIQPDQYVLVCSSAWKGRKLKDILMQERIIDYHASDHLTYDYLRAYKLLRYAQRDRMFANRTELIAQMIEAGIGYSVLSESFVKRYADHGSLHILNKGASFAQQLVCAWSSQEIMPGYLQALIDAIN